MPFPVSVASKKKAIVASDSALVILSEEFLKRNKGLRAAQYPGKVFLIHCAAEGKGNLALLKMHGCFDYFTDHDSAKIILFKIQRALNTVDFKVRIGNLERELSSRHRKIEKIVLTDPLTGCYNWRYFLRRAQQELSRARRHLSKLSFVVIDIDHFRQINEMYTVKFADHVIKEMAGILQDNLRQEDILARWREDEFFIILPYQGRTEAYRVGTRIRNKISAYRFQHKNITVRLKVSVCMVSFPEDRIFSVKDVINTLERCLIEVKRRGGDSAMLYSQPQPVLIEKGEKKETVGELKSKIERLNSLLSRDILEMIFGFARAIEAKDSYTGRHVETTSLLAEKIAKELQLPSQEAENVKRAAVLHDLGKVGIEESILSKKGPLTFKEKEVIKSHPWIAAEILREIHGLRGAIPAILYHHERYDGKGYPIGLKGEEIPLSARIVAISDVYQALVSDRPYRKAFTKRQALSIIKNESGKQFDPKIVKIFLKVIKKID
ncbi:MAG: diguanylate cyclase [Candidatus Omnitrophota bacterium]|nr:diguanylate cyclase [Candidatus Omnitrophota bacterium]